MKILIIGLLQLFFSLADAKGNILRVFPEGQQVEYSYHAIVTTGSQPSTPFVSQFNLTGKVTVQSHTDCAVVQLSDLKYSALNGESQSRNRDLAAKVPLSPEAAALSTPFSIHYNHGKVVKIVIDAEEPKWSASVKQALAGALQLDVTRLNSGTGNHQSFTTKEDSIHGVCSMLYSVKHEKEDLVITKVRSSTDCASEPVTWSNVEEAPCSSPGSIQYGLVSSGQKVYNLSPYNDDDSLLIKRLWSEGVTYTSPTRSSNQAFTITVSQLFELQKVQHVSKHLEVNNPQEMYSLKYDSNEFYSFKFSTDEDLSKVVGKVLNLVFLISTKLQSEDFQTFENDNPQQSHIISLLITFLRKLDVNLLENILNEIEKRNSASARQIFVKILPLVGSRESALFLINLIEKKRIQNAYALYVLSSLPLNIRQTTESVLLELEVLIQLPEEVSYSVRNAAILTFSTLIYRTCSFNKCSSETTSKYTNHYLEHIKDSTSSYEQQQLYMAGLQNIQPDQLLDILKPFIFGDNNSAYERLRVSAVRAAFPTVANNPDEVYEIYWPVLSNRALSLELRATALMLIMKTELSLSMALHLHWLMADEPCHHIYNLYFTLIKSYAETKHDCFTKRSEIARRVLVLSHPPNPSIFTTFYQKFEISSRDFIEVVAIANLESGLIDSLYISCYNAIGKITNYFSVYTKTKGVNKELLKLFAKFIVAHFKDHPDSETSPEFIQPLDIELILYVHGKAVATRLYNENNLSQLFKEIKWILNVIRESKFSFYQIANTFSLEKFFVTDLGMPGVLSADFPTLSVFHRDPLEENYNIRYWSQGSTVFKVKNTIASIWQGIIKTQVSRYNLPLHVNFKIGNLQLILSRPVSSSGLFGFEWYTNTDVFTVTYHNKYDALLESCRKCEGLLRVNKPTKTEKIVNEIKDDSISLKTASVCEDDGSINYVRSVENNYAKGSLSFVGVLLSGGYFIKNSLSELPISGSCSYVLFLAPEESNHTTKFCVNIKHDYSSKLQHSFDWKNKTTKADVLISYGGTRQSGDGECQYKSSSAEVVVEECVEEEHLSENQDVCFIDQCKLSSDSSRINKLIKFSASFSQVPEDIQTFILGVIGRVQSRTNQHLSHEVKSSPPSQNLQVELVLNCKNRTYSLDLGTTSRKMISKHAPFDIFSSIVMLLKKTWQSWDWP